MKSTSTSEKNNSSLVIRHSSFVNMKTRIFTNWRTSLLGALFLLISLVLVFNKIIAWGEFMAFLPTIFGLLYVKDTIFQVKSKE